MGAYQTVVAGTDGSETSLRAVESAAASARDAGAAGHQVVRDHSADLLVVGNRGRTTLAGRILGSVPLDVARHPPVDVLIVHTT